MPVPLAGRVPHARIDRVLPQIQNEHLLLMRPSHKPLVMIQTYRVSPFFFFSHRINLRVLKSCTPDDPHIALTTQALNADGTPKRPMNAFMIFARKRRPQISAANQMMRTGDISKILSREWNTMELVRFCHFHDREMLIIKLGR